MRKAGGRCALALAALIATWGHIAAAQGKDRMVGNWLISEEADHFGNGARVLAMHGNGTGAFVGLRCLSDMASIALSEAGPAYRAGESVNVKFRADDGVIVNTFAKALDDRTIEIMLKPGMLGSIAKSRRLSFRIMTESVSFDRSYVANGNAAAVAAVQKACPLDE